MSRHSSEPQSQPVPGYVDHVVRKEELLKRHPDVVIELDETASPYERWRGVVPGRGAVSSWDLGRLLDRVEEVIAAAEAGQRWPGWTFARSGNRWEARETAGARVVVGTTLHSAEAQVGQTEHGALPIRRADDAARLRESGCGVCAVAATR